MIYNNVVVGYDTFLSTWGPGQAAGGCYAGWACRDEDLPDVLAWVKSRSDMIDVEVVDESWAPPGKQLFHIYRVFVGHAALKGAF